MAHTIESRANIPANRLRDALDSAERLVVTVDKDTVEDLLLLFDSIEQMFDEMAETDIDLRPEKVRRQSLLNRVYSRPLPIVRAANKAGGMHALRDEHPPAEGDWWRLDSLVYERRRKSAIRTVSTLLIVVGVVGLLYWAINTLFPPDPNAVLMVETTAKLDVFVRDQRWEEALALVDSRLEQIPEEAELWIWKTVLHERLSEAEEAALAQAEAQRLLADKLPLFWVVLGNTRFQVGDIDGAEAAGNQVIALNPDDPQGYFLLGSVAETRGDIATAVEMFDKTFTLAEKTNPELAVIARVRLGQMLQSPALPGATAAETPVGTPGSTPTP